MSSSLYFDFEIILTKTLMTGLAKAMGRKCTVVAFCAMEGLDGML